MTIDIIVPELGESITEATVAKWFKEPGATITRDEILVELETDKVNVEITASSSGTLAEVVAGAGEDVAVGALLGRISEGDAPAAPAPAAAPSPAPGPATEPSPAPAAQAAAPDASPAVRRLVAENNLDVATITGTGKDGRVLKGDVINALKAGPSPAAPSPGADGPAAPSSAPTPGPATETGGERRVPMTRLRRRVAERLKQAQNTAAMLTTFNEVDMTQVMALRKQYRESFEKKYGIRLGFMSFFVRACVVALKEQDAVNAEVDGTDIIYKDYYNIGVAVGAPQGLVVPVLRNADRMGFADIEQAISGFGAKARDGKLTIDDMTGGTFTISNGGIYGSLLSTPILNTPQSAILGMHKIQPRPMAMGDEVAVRPMMYLALSYDHRIVDGREAVTFLVRIKECIEDPQRILLDI